jgi:hypothetical protein
MRLNLSAFTVRRNTPFARHRTSPPGYIELAGDASVEILMLGIVP